MVDNHVCVSCCDLSLIQLNPEKVNVLHFTLEVTVGLSIEGRVGNRKTNYYFSFKSTARSWACYTSKIDLNCMWRHKAIVQNSRSRTLFIDNESQCTQMGFRTTITTECWCVTITADINLISSPNADMHKPQHHACIATCKNHGETQKLTPCTTILL